MSGMTKIEYGDNGTEGALKLADKCLQFMDLIAQGHNTTPFSELEWQDQRTIKTLTFKGCVTVKDDQVVLTPKGKLVLEGMAARDYKPWRIKGYVKGFGRSRADARAEGV